MARLQTKRGQRIVEPDLKLVLGKRIGREAVSKGGLAPAFRRKVLHSQYRRGCLVSCSLEVNVSFCGASRSERSERSEAPRPVARSRCLRSTETVGQQDPGRFF